MIFSNPQLETILSTDITVRFIRESDLAAFKALRLEALRDHPEAFGSDHDESSREPDLMWVDRVKNAIGSPDGCIVVAEAGGQLAGMAGVFRNNRVKVRHSGTIWGVYVRPQFRGSKLTERMISEALGWCRANQIRIARLTVVTCNGPAIRTYLRCGFTIYGVSPEEIRIGDVYHDEMLMWRRV